MPRSALRRDASMRSNSLFWRCTSEVAFRFVLLRFTPYRLASRKYLAQIQHSKNIPLDSFPEFGGKLIHEFLLSTQIQLRVFNLKKLDSLKVISAFAILPRFKALD